MRKRKADTTARISVSYEEDGDEIIMLFVPNMSKPEHYHIHLTTDGAENLSAALDRFLAGDYEHLIYDIPIGEVIA